MNIVNNAYIIKIEKLLCFFLLGICCIEFNLLVLPVVSQNKLTMNNNGCHDDAKILLIGW